MTEQLEFASGMRSGKARGKKGPHLAARMIAALTVARKDLTRRDFAELHGFSRDGRECRLGRAASNGRIIQTPAGYRLLRFSNPDQFRTCIANLDAQIRALQEQKRVLLKRYHSGNTMHTLNDLSDAPNGAERKQA